MAYPIVQEKNPREPFVETEDSLYIPTNWQVIALTDLTIAEVLALSELPQQGDQLTGSDARVTRRTGAKQLGTGNKHIWDLDIIYEVNPQGDGTDPSGNATEGEVLRLVSYSAGFNSYAYEVERSYTGSVLNVEVLNTAGEQFDPAIMDLNYNLVLRWTQKESSSFRPNISSYYMNTINSGGMTILGISIGVGKGLLRNISSVLRRTSLGSVYYETTYEVEVNDKGWNPQRKNQGFKQLVGGKLYDIHKGDVNTDLASGTEEQQIEALEKINLPATLNQAGEYTSEEPVYLDFQTKRKTNWRSGLNLVTTIK